MDFGKWLQQDITFCMTENCPIRQYCHRAIGCKKRIASYSDYSSICNINNVFSYFIQACEEDMKKGLKVKK